MSKRRVTVHIDPDLAAEVRAAIGPEGFMTEAVDAALRLWLANKRVNVEPVLPVLDATPEPRAEPAWSNAYRPPSTTRALGD